MLSKYDKLIMAVLGVILLGLKDFGLIDLTSNQDIIYRVVVSIATAFGVWVVPNKTV